MTTICCAELRQRCKKLLESQLCLACTARMCCCFGLLLPLIQGPVSKLLWLQLDAPKKSALMSRPHFVCLGERLPCPAGACALLVESSRHRCTAPACKGPVVLL
jgi:hypothetical protein